MALLVDANGEYVNHGSASGAAGVDDVFKGTVMCWVRLASLSANPKFFAAKGSAWSYQFTNSHGVIFSISRAVQSMLILVTNANLPVAPAAGVWYFVAATFDTAGATGDQVLYTGNLATDATAATVYAVQRAGSGTATSNAADDMIIANLSAAASTSFLEGDMAFFGLWANVLLTPGQIIEQQRRPHVTSGCVLFSHYHGTGTQPDLTGNGNNGTVTNATASGHVPLGPPFGFDPEWQGAIAAAAAFVGDDDDGLIPVTRYLW